MTMSAENFVEALGGVMTAQDRATIGAEHQERAARLGARQAAARRKPNAVPACEFCRFLPGAKQCNKHAAETTAAVATYPAWLQRTIEAHETDNRRAQWRRRSAAYRQRYPERRRASVQAYAASPMAALARERYYHSRTGMDTRLRAYLRRLRARVDAYGMDLASGLEDVERTFDEHLLRGQIPKLPSLDEVFGLDAVFAEVSLPRTA